MLSVNTESSKTPAPSFPIPSVAYSYFVLEEQGKESDLLRFCLSDKVAFSLEQVLEGNTTPVDYANSLIEHHSDQLKTLFFSQELKDRHYPSILEQSFIFDQLVTLAALYRSIKVRPTKVDDVVEMMISSQVHLLLLDYPKKPASLYSGLDNYSVSAKCFIKENVDIFIDKDIDLLQQTISLISCAGQDDWLLNRPVWRNVFSKNHPLLKSFRLFLHTALVSRSMDDEAINELFHLSHSDVDQLLQLFVAAAEYDNLKADELVEFLGLINKTVKPLSVKHYYAFLMEMPFINYCHADHQIYPHKHQLGN